ncbi:MAG: hypothetical protein CMP67_08975 [Flavobacteriales bacterium]|nr:hypothetical protein [Flavobacteriales bacterium]|tara:strand:+ start:1361 stop:2383 length:1023 start_codon:yes stop_codon:yes gene_type:complete
MKTCLKILLITVCFQTSIAQSGGQSGATQLLINSWGKSSGVGGSDAAFGSGIEMVYMNPAGVSGTNKTDLLFSRSNWLQGSEIYINAFGVSQRFNEKTVLALSIMSFNLGDIEITTVNNPEGGIGTYRPQFVNGGLTYSREFSNNIDGGITLKLISEGIHDVNAFGLALDAGVKYVTGKKEHISFGVALKNAGPNMKYDGNGLKMEMTFPNGNNQSGQISSASYTLPLLMNLGFGYRFEFNSSHSVQTGFTYSARMFLNDQTRMGVEYRFKKYLQIRGGFVYEEGIFEISTRQTAITGPSGGFSFQLPYGKDNRYFGFDYTYRDTNPFEGIHTFGARIIL